MGNNGNNKGNDIIYKLIQQKATFSQMAKDLKISKGTLSKRLKQMEANGLLHRKREGKLLIVSIPQAILNSLDKIPSYRIHNLWLTFQLKDSVGNDTTKLLASKSIKLKPLRLANHTDSYFIQDGYEARLNPNSLELHLNDLDGLALDSDLREAIVGLMAKLESIIIKLEDRLGLKVIRIDKDTLIAKISQLHIALRDHKFAETINEKGEKLYVYVNDELRVIVDHSHGLHEYEAVNAKYSIDDAQKLGKLTKATITGAFDYEKDHELVHMLIQAQTRTQEQLDFYAKNIEAHASAIIKLNGVLTKLDKRMSQRKLFE